jgi:endonuclease YncB( thermonuclease family)
VSRRILLCLPALLTAAAAVAPAGAESHGYVIRARDGPNVNLRLVADGAAAPYFYAGRRGRFANLLERLARHARARHLGLWELCTRTPDDPYHRVSTRR